MPAANDQLRSDLVALAVAEPQSIAEVVLACVKKQPQLEGMIKRMVQGLMPTRLMAPQATEEVLPKATKETLAAVKTQYQALIAKMDIRHQPPLVLDDVVADISVKKGDPSIIIGGNVASLAAVANLVEALGGNAKSDLSRISDAIAEQLSGNVSRRTMTRGRAPAIRPGAAAAAAAATEADEPSVQALQVLAAFWTPAAAIRRAKGEGARAYLDRLLAAARKAMADGDKEAKEALASLTTEFPKLLKA